MSVYVTIYDRTDSFGDRIVVERNDDCIIITQHFSLEEDGWETTKPVGIRLYDGDMLGVANAIINSLSEHLQNGDEHE